MKNKAEAAKKIIRDRPSETKWTAAGLVTGSVTGFLIGGVGIVAMGTGFGIPAAVVLGITGGAIGNRIGISKDRPVKPKAD